MFYFLALLSIVDISVSFFFITFINESLEVCVVVHAVKMNRVHA